MYKILRKCLSMVLAVMLLASLSVVNSLNASADNKTGDGLAAYAMRAYNEGWQYVWGGASPGSVDCSGLIYSYVEGGARVTEDMLYSSPESGYVSDGVPDIPGLGLWQPGHVGVYVGGGMAVDARDEISNVCYQSVATKSWVMWFKVNGVSYGTDSSVTNDDSANQQEEYQEEYQDENNFLQKHEQEDEPYAAPNEEIEEDTIEDNKLFYDSEENVNIPTDTDNEISDNVTSYQYDNSFFENYTVLQSESDYNVFPQQDLNEDFDSADENTTEENTEEDTKENYSVYPDAVYQYGDTGTDISNIQFMLLKLGYYDYLISGEYDKNTVDSVRMFQLDYKLDFTGSLNENALSTLYRVYDDSLKIKQPSLESDYNEFSPEESINSSDTDTKSVQNNEAETSLSSDNNISVNEVEFIVPSSSSDSDISEKSVVGSSNIYKSPKTGNTSFPGFLSHWQDYIDSTFILAVIIFSIAVIFFAGTVHYWNISMEKRKQRLKKDITAPICKKRFM